jgi:hypothetical protein
MRLTTVSLSDSYHVFSVKNAVFHWVLLRYSIEWTRYLWLMRGIARIREPSNSYMGCQTKAIFGKLKGAKTQNV